jgi:hypothetical protein
MDLTPLAFDFLSSKTYSEKELQLYGSRSPEVAGTNSNVHSRSVYLQMEYFVASPFSSFMGLLGKETVIVWWGSVVPYKNHMILRMIFRSGHIDIFGQLGS